MRKQSEVVTLYLKGLSRKEIAHATGKSYKNICEQLRRKGLPKPVQLRTVRDRTYTVYPYNDKHPQLVWPPLARPYKLAGSRITNSSSCPIGKNQFQNLTPCEQFIGQRHAVFTNARFVDENGRLV